MNTDIYIQNTISEYNDISYDLNNIYCDLAMEAENVTSVDDDSNKESFARKLGNTIEKIIAELYAIIDKFMSHMKNVITRIAQTDVGFKEHCRKAMVKNKPLEAVKLIVYNYNINYLEDQMNRITKECTNVLTGLKTDYQKNDTSSTSAIEMKYKDIVAYILSKVGCPDNVTDINLYFEFLKKNYRVEKKEMLFKSSEGKIYFGITLEQDKLKSIVDSKQLMMKNQANVLKTEMLDIIRNKQTQNDVKRKATKIYKNAGNVYNFYTAFLKIYIQFKIERILTYRVVLKKLWHFS